MRRIAETCVDMQIHKHINVVGAQWYRCKRLLFAGDLSTWELSQTGRYDLFEAYQKRPHIQLIKASDDGALRDFVKAWGPLRARLDSWSGCDPIERYRRTRDVLTASVRLLASIEEPAMQREALQDLVQLGDADDTAFHAFLGLLRARFSIAGELRWGFDANLQGWVETASAKDIEAACITLVSSLPLEQFTHKLEVASAGRSNVVRASIGVTSLEEALHWMMWQDVFHRHPFQFCEECRVLFQPDWKHAKKFCTPECAHRKTGREWQKRKRKGERGEYGTQKAR